jgi:hypothetical protein
MKGLQDSFSNKMHDPIHEAARQKNNFGEFLLRFLRELLSQKQNGRRATHDFMLNARFFVLTGKTYSSAGNSQVTFLFHFRFVPCRR